MPECRDEKEYTLIVNLSEDVVVDTIVISNHEDFSDTLSSIHFQGSIDYPPEQEWLDIGELVPSSSKNEHVLDVIDRTQMIRYLKVTLKSPMSNELYCTITSMKVYGKGMHVVMRNSLMPLMDLAKPTENEASPAVIKP